MSGPHRVVLVGQAFTAYEPGLEVAVGAFTDQTALGDVEVSFTRFGAGIQATTACTVALGPIYDDPLGLAPSPSDPIGRAGGGRRARPDEDPEAAPEAAPPSTSTPSASAHPHRTSPATSTTKGKIA
jgi:hypothetical protein